MKRGLMTMCFGVLVVGGALAQSSLTLNNPLVGPDGRVVGRGAIGIMFDAVENPATARVYGAGVTLSGVVTGGPADRAGLKIGDTITSVDGRKVTNRAELAAEFASWKPGAKAVIGFLRSGKQQETTVTVADAGKLFAAAVKEDDRGMGVRGSRSGSGDNDEGTPRQSKLGVAVRSLTPEMAERLNMPAGKGVIVQDVIARSFAEDISLGRGDVILEVNKQPVNSEEDFAHVESSLKSGQDAVFLVRPRGSSAQDGTVFLAGTLP